MTAQPATDTNTTCRLTYATSPLTTAGSFASRLNRLFDAIYPVDRGPFTSQELIKWAARGGMRISAPYLSQLRTGQRTQPSQEVMELIAEFFGIRADYFTDTDQPYQRMLDEELDWLDLARNPAVRQLTTALAELDPNHRERIMAAAGI